jgi:hypothetical protein
VDVATDLPLAWTIRPANESEQHFAIGLLDKVRALDFPVRTMIADKGYDTNMIHVKCEYRDVAPVIPLKAERGYEEGKRGRTADPPHFAHGESTFAGADYSARQRSGAARPASASPRARGSEPTGCAHSSPARPRLIESCTPSA